MRTKGIGPQGLGLKGNNGYSIGSPAKKLGGACWDGYEAIGMKNKGGRKVPNCVPKK
jgi:hypothetical protein|tara:strand:+ start:868 stop:1038 length:171 start_codon:yes stop_codon:yes gene_type:complete